MSGYRLRCMAAARSVRWTGAASDRALPLRRRHLCHLCLLCPLCLPSAWRHVRSANSRPFSSQADRGLPQASTRSTAPTQLVISELSLGKLSGQCPHHAKITALADPGSFASSQEPVAKRRGGRVRRCKQSLLADGCRTGGNRGISVDLGLASRTDSAARKGRMAGCRSAVASGSRKQTRPAWRRCQLLGSLRPFQICTLANSTNAAVQCWTAAVLADCSPPPSALCLCDLCDLRRNEPGAHLTVQHPSSTRLRAGGQRENQRQGRFGCVPNGRLCCARASLLEGSAAGGSAEGPYLQCRTWLLEPTASAESLCVLS